MAKEAKEKPAKESVDAPKVYTRSDVQEVLDSITQHTSESKNSFMHSIVLLNSLLRQPNADELFDEPLKQQARDLWMKMKTMGVQLQDPPLLFGHPPKDGVAQA